MFYFRESYFRLVGLFDWGYTRTQFLLSVSRNRYGFTLAGYQNEKSTTDPALISSVSHGFNLFPWAVGYRIFSAIFIYLILLPCQYGHILKSFSLYPFYPTALKGCRGIVFTHGVEMGRRVAGKSL